MTTDSNQCQRYAFISYNHRDVKVAQWLHKKLEGYKLPNEIHNEFEDSRYLRPVFRDQEDLNAGILGDELRSKLESSKFLIVICSPNSAHSVWVSNEVKTFIEMGRLERIIPFIIDGVPGVGGAEECFPEYLCSFTAEHPEKELLGVNLQEVGREKAFIRIVSRMLGVDFDVLWKRHEREQKKKIVLGATITPILFVLSYLFAVPFSISVNIIDEKHNLPALEQGVLEVNGARYHFESLDTTIEVTDLPGYMRFHDIPYRAFANIYYDTVSSTIALGMGMDTKIDIQMRRSDHFAVFAGVVRDESFDPIENALVEIENQKAYTNSKGEFSIRFSMPEQTEQKAVTISKDGYQIKQRADETPSNTLGYILERQ